MGIGRSDVRADLQRTQNELSACRLQVQQLQIRLQVETARADATQQELKKVQKQAAIARCQLDALGDSDFLTAVLLADEDVNLPYLDDAHEREYLKTVISSIRAIISDAASARDSVTDHRNSVTLTLA